jgi:Ser/Thr protein kinase RdoA (MazF antagonist)
MSPDVSTRTAIAENALSHFEIEPCSVDFLQHSGAITYRVRDKRGCDYLLRVYLPLSKFIASHWMRPDHVRSEMMWLNYLLEEGSVTVQEPVKTRQGDWIAVIDPGNGRQITCTLLRWLAGEGGRDVRLDKMQARQSALLLARLHQLWSKWSAPPGFSRPCYDIRYIRSALVEAEKHVEQNTIEASDFSLIEKSLEILCSIMQDLGESPAHWGLIHGDFFHLNFIFHGDKMFPIDFSECGFGHYMLDIAPSLLRLGTEKQTFLETYGSVRSLPENAKRLADAFCIADIVRWLAFTASLPDRYEKVAGLVKHPITKFCRKFLAGELFLFETDS